MSNLLGKPKNGFTLIELSIVLVIIGLIVGGIVTGQDLIRTAAARAQISQIEKYNTAVHTFQGKYGYLPGDIPNPYASNFGFQFRGSCPGQGDGNGIITGVDGSGCAPGISDNGNMEGAGETAMLWVDLSTAGLIEGRLNTASPTTLAGTDVTSTGIGNYLPQAKMGQNNYIYAWTGGTFTTYWLYNGINYFGVSAVSTIASSSNYGKIASTPGLTVAQAYNIDKKIDDGYPQTGNAIAVYLDYSGDPRWTDGGDTLTNPPYTGGTPGSPTTCYDNGNVSGQQKYSMEENGGNGLNCALSFRMQ